MSTSNRPEYGNRRAVRFFVMSVALFLVLFGSVPHISAQEESYTPPTVVELDKFRQELGQVLREINGQRETLKQNNLLLDARLTDPRINAAPSLAQALQQLQGMNYEDLAVVHRAFTTFVPQWRDLPEMFSRIGKIRSKSSGSTERKAVITPDSCSDAELLAPSWSDLAALKATELGLAGAFEVIPEPLNGPAVGFWLAAAEFSLAGETLISIYDRCHGDADVAEIKTKIDTVETRVSEVGNSIKENDDHNTGVIIRSFETGLANSNTEVINNDNSNRAMILTSITNTKNEIVNNDNANATTLNTNLVDARNAIITNNNTNTTNIINNINSNAATLRDLLLRTQIEADLAEADNATFVGLYVTPTANGGYFDFARFIVVDTIAKLAGADASKANGFLAKSDADRNAGNFKSAYQWLRKAYKAAVN
jgi:hypothetical protein